MQDETQRSAAEEAEERMPEAESVLPTAPEVSVGDVQTLGGAATRAARKAELKPGQEKPRQMKVGRVVSDKMQKTVVVAVDTVRRHRLYHKRITRTSKFLAHDEFEQAKPGDLVRIEETRPLSKRKRWIVREIIERGVQV
jgi:small subunit ribosomal protein S17